MNPADHAQAIILIMLAVAAGKPLSLLGSVFVGVITVIFRWPMHAYRALGAISTVWFVAAHPWLTAALVAGVVGLAVAVVAVRRADRPLAPAVAW
jgi:hypothetical protein